MLFLLTVKEADGESGRTGFCVLRRTSLSDGDHLHLCDIRCGAAQFKRCLPSPACAGRQMFNLLKGRGPFYLGLLWPGRRRTYTYIPSGEQCFITLIIWDHWKSCSDQTSNAKTSYDTAVSESFSFFLLFDCPHHDILWVWLVSMSILRPESDSWSRTKKETSASQHFPDATLQRSPANSTFNSFIMRTRWNDYVTLRRSHDLGGHMIPPVLNQWKQIT